MNLNDINSGPLPSDKSFLNPICNKITCSTLISNSFNVGQTLSSGNVKTITTTGGLINLLPSDIISGVIGLIIHGTGPITVSLQLPTQGALDAALSSFTQPFYFQTSISAVFDTTITQGNITIVNAGTSISTYDSSNNLQFIAYLNTAPVTPQNRWQRTMTLSRKGAGWAVYA